jgi:hypothetical protein
MTSTSEELGLPNHAIIGLVSLILTTVLVPVGWVVHRYWITAGW